MIVVKEDGLIRLCGDYKAIVNSVCVGDLYFFLRVEDMLVRLVGCRRFTKIDFS